MRASSMMRVVARRQRCRGSGLEARRCKACSPPSARPMPAAAQHADQHQDTQPIVPSASSRRSYADQKNTQSIVP